MPNIRRFVLGVDLDGVCADFYRGLRPIAAEWLGVDAATLPERVSWGLPEWGIDKAPGGYEALHRFAGYAERVVPHPTADARCPGCPSAALVGRCAHPNNHSPLLYQVLPSNGSASDDRVVGLSRYSVLGSVLHAGKGSGWR